MRPRFWLGLLVGAAVGYWATFALLATLEARMREAAALSCTHYTDGTDAEVAACYDRQGLPVPEDIS